MELMTSAPVPVFVIVRATGALAVPTNWFAKFTVEGEREIAACVAVPVKDTECGLPAALSEIEIEAEQFPAATGLKITIIWQDTLRIPGAGQLSVSLKSFAFTPVTASFWVIVTGAVPVLERVIVCDGLGVPTL